MSPLSVTTASSVMDISTHIEWVDLPTEVWGHILSFLDGRSLIRISETCVKLNNIIDLHPNLIDRIWIKLNGDGTTDEEFKAGLHVIQKTRRKYKQLFLNYTKQHWFDDETFNNVLKQLGRSVTALATDSTKFATRGKLVETLRLFPNLKRMQLKFITIENEENSEINSLDEFVHLPHLHDLYLVEFYPWFCDILSPNVQLTRIEAYIIKWTETDTIPFENFVFKQQRLQKLRLGIFRQGRLFKVDRTNEIKFQLDRLLLNGAFYASQDNLLRFVQSQRKLKDVRINLSNEYERKLDDTFFYNDVMVHVLSEMKELKTIGVHQDKFKFPDLEFIRVLPLNNNVENLYIEGESVDVFSALVSILPNIKKLVYDANLYPTSVPDVRIINQMENLESLALNMFSVESLQEIHLEKLNSFDFVARSCAGRDFALDMRAFMSRHRALTKLRIGVVKFMANLSVDMEICEYMAANLTQLSFLNVQNFDDTNSNICFLAKNMTSLQSIEVNDEQFKEITCTTFDECSFNGVCLSIGK